MQRVSKPPFAIKPRVDTDPTRGQLRLTGSANVLSLPTVSDAHAKILDDLFLVRHLRPWPVNLASRQMKSTETYVVDSGMLAYLIGADEQRIVDDGAIAGTMLESFVAMTLLRHADRPVQRFHYRDQHQREPTIAIECHDVDVVEIDVKASAAPAATDFKGLGYLRDRLDPRFKAGVLLHTGADTLPFGDRVAAVPASGLWSGSGVPSATTPPGLTETRRRGPAPVARR